MKRIGITSLAWSAVLLFIVAGAAIATPLINGATIETRTFNDCGLSTLTTSNNYPASIEITDVMDPLCVGFANLHSFSFSADGGGTAAVFNNNSNFRFSADFKIDGPGEGEGGLRISPWYGKFVDGRFMANATTGEIACFGGALPFYTFTAAPHGITYTKGTTIHLEVTYRANDLFTGDPASIQYRVIYNGNTYDSPELPFGIQNVNECDPNGLFGMLNDGRAGGYFQPRANTGASLTATWSNIQFACLPSDGTPVANGATVETRTFNDCPLSTVTTSNNYPNSIEITDVMDPLCVGFANLHSFSFSEDGGTTAAAFNNNSDFRFGADFKIDGPGEGEGGLRISPWYGKFVDGRFMANATTGEIACFGGALPFYTFTAAPHGITYTKGTTIRLEVTYRANDLVQLNPATIQYRVIYNGNTYDSPVLPFGKQNAGECNPNGLWGMLNDGRAGGYFQPRANTGASLTGTWSNITYTLLAASVDLTFEPGTLNLKSHGKWVTAYLEPAAPYTAGDIDASSLQLNGVAVDPAAPTSIGDNDSDGIPDLAVKFSRSDVAALLAEGQSVDVTVVGSIGGQCFSATDQIKVKSKVLDSPAAGSVYAPGSTVDVSWDKDFDADAVDIVSSYDDGLSWNVVAQAVSNSGRYRWTAPAVSTARARIGVVVIGGSDESGFVATAELGESGAFAIGSTTGVGEGGALEFAMPRIAPNPTRNEFTVSFVLPSGKAASLAVYDVSGREVASRQVGMLGAGQHAVTFGRRETLRAGVYQVRLTQDGRSLTRRAIVVQ